MAIPPLPLPVFVGLLPKKTIGCPEFLFGLLCLFATVIGGDLDLDDFIPGTIGKRDGLRYFLRPTDRIAVVFARFVVDGFIVLIGLRIRVEV